MVIHLVENKWVIVLAADAVELCEAVLHELHVLALGRHLGHGKLEALVWHRFYWTKLGANVCKFCIECDVC